MFNLLFLITLTMPDPQTLSNIIDENAKSTGVDPQLMVAIAYHESKFKLNAVSATKKDFGVFQIRYGAATRGFKLHKKDLLDPEINTVLAVLYVREQLDRCKTTAKALGAYSSGKCTVNNYSKTILRTYCNLKSFKNNVTKRIVYRKLWLVDQKMLGSTRGASKNSMVDPFSLNQAQLQDSL